MAVSGSWRLCAHMILTGEDSEFYRKTVKLDPVVAGDMSATARMEAMSQHVHGSRGIYMHLLSGGEPIPPPVS